MLYPIELRTRDTDFTRAFTQRRGDCPQASAMNKIESRECREIYVRAFFKRLVVFCNRRLSDSTCFDNSINSSRATIPAFATLCAVRSALPIASPIFLAARLSRFLAMIVLLFEQLPSYTRGTRNVNQPCKSPFNRAGQRAILYSPVLKRCTSRRS